MKERRQYYRLETDIPATIRKKDSSVPVPARIANISIAGAYIITRTPIRSGKQIELCFYLPSSREQYRMQEKEPPSQLNKNLITCSAKIRWTAEMKTYHGGVEFMKINRIDRYRIAGFIKVNLRRMSFKQKMVDVP